MGTSRSEAVMIQSAAGTAPDLRRPLPAHPGTPPDPSRPGRLRPPDLRRRDLSRRRFQGADFRDALLRETLLRGAVLLGCDLRGADLRGADLWGCDLSFSDLRGCRIETTRLVEIRLPPHLPLVLVNQIRAFDFVHALPRNIAPAPHPAPLPCPYADASFVPLLHVWGSATWDGGAGWTPPPRIWSLHRIIGAILDLLGCRHDVAPGAPCPEGFTPP